MGIPDGDEKQELDRIRRAYGAYWERGRQERWLSSQPANRLMQEERRRVFGSLIEEADFRSNRALVLDIGCGSGGSMREWISIGIGPSRLFGVDLLLGRVTEAPDDLRRGFACASAHHLPFGDGTFDAVSLFTVFSSILSKRLMRAVAAESKRVLRPRGLIVCYDMRLPNPFNPNIRPVSLRGLRSLFIGAEIRSTTLTLLPPLARRWLRSASAYERWTALRVPQTHRLAAISFPESDAEV